MKTKEYVLKYKLDVSNKFNHNEFVFDLTNEFLSCLEVGKGRESVKGYDNAVRVIRMKWDAIHNKTVDGLSEKLWNYFYATVIIKLRKEFFPDVVANEERIRNEKRETWERKRKWEEDEQRAEQFNYWSIINALLGQYANKIPESSFAVLGLPTTATEDEVKTRYRELSLKHHPDKGGKQDLFIEITEAKNKVLSYLSSI